MTNPYPHKSQKIKICSFACREASALETPVKVEFPNFLSPQNLAWGFDGDTASYNDKGKDYQLLNFHNETINDMRNTID